MYIFYVNSISFWIYLIEILTFGSRAWQVCRVLSGCSVRRRHFCSQREHAGWWSRWSAATVEPDSRSPSDHIRGLLVFEQIFVISSCTSSISLTELSLPWPLITVAVKGWTWAFPPLKGGCTATLPAPLSIVCHDQIWMEELLGKSFISQV